MGTFDLDIEYNEMALTVTGSYSTACTGDYLTPSTGNEINLMDVTDIDISIYETLSIDDIDEIETIIYKEIF